MDRWAAREAVGRPKSNSDERFLECAVSMVPYVEGERTNAGQERQDVAAGWIPGMHKEIIRVMGAAEDNLHRIVWASPISLCWAMDSWIGDLEFGVWTLALCFCSGSIKAELTGFCHHFGHVNRV